MAHILTRWNPHNMSSYGIKGGWKKWRKYGEGNGKVKGYRVGGDSFPSPLSYSSTSSYQHSSLSQKKDIERVIFKFPLLNLNVKFDSPMNNGMLDVKKLDSWIE